MVLRVSGEGRDEGDEDEVGRVDGDEGEDDEGEGEGVEGEGRVGGGDGLKDPRRVSRVVRFRACGWWQDGGDW